MNKSSQLALVAVLVFIGLAGTCCSTSDRDAQPSPQPTASGGLRRMVKLPDLIDFEKFQLTFKKHYPSLLEKMARAKLFAANAFNVFVSYVKYIWRASTKFLVINRWSDLTVKELRKFFNRDGGRLVPLKTEPERGADLEDVEEKLEEIVEHKKDNELYGEIAAELEKKQTGWRRKRSADADDTANDGQPLKRDLSMEELIRKPSGSSDSEQLGVKPVSWDERSAMPAEEAKVIIQESNVGWFESAMKSVANHAAAAITKYAPLIRSDPRPGAKWVYHSRPRRPNVPDQIFFDYNDSGCMPPIEDQGECGCCYVMAATAFFEYHHCDQTKNRQLFSKQFTLDCGLQHRRNNVEPESIRLIGCGGGREDHVAFFFDAYGLRFESELPFRRSEGSCPVSSPEEAKRTAKVVVDPIEWTWLDPKELSAETIVNYLTTKGPMTISINIDQDFIFYGGGVDMLEKCSEDDGHVMNMVGYGIEDGYEYWLIRNSHSELWGARGHYKLSITARGCMKFIGYTEPKFRLNN